MPTRRRKRRSANEPRRVIVLFVADTHAGNRLGLMNPDVTLFEQNETGELVPFTPALTRLQVKLWRWFEDDLRFVQALAGGDEIIYIHQGDIVQGSKHPALHVHGDRRTNQLLIAASNQAPILSLPNVREARFVAGTAAHDGIGADQVITVVTMLRPKFADVNMKVLYHGTLDIDGFTVDYAHHGPHPGGRSWLEGNTLLYYLRDAVFKEWLGHAKPAARVLTRAHQHAYRRATFHTMLAGEQHQFDAFLLPSWCGVQDFARQVTRSEPEQQFGMLALEVVGGELVKAHPLVHTQCLRTEEKL